MSEASKDFLKNITKNTNCANIPNIKYVSKENLSHFSRTSKWSKEIKMVMNKFYENRDRSNSL